MSSLCAFIDDSGTGLDLPHFLLGGVAVVPEARSEALSDEAASFDRKATEWDASSLLRCAEFLSRPELYPFAAWILPLKSIVDSAERRVREAKDDLRRRGQRLGRQHDLRAQTQIYMSVAATAFAACVIAPLSYHSIESVRVVADRITMREEYRRILRCSVERQTGTVVAANARVGAYAANARWSSPELDWQSGGPFLTLADAYCHIVRRALQGDPGAEDAMRHIQTTMRYQQRGNAIAALRVDDTERVRVQMARPFLVDKQDR